MWQAYRNFTIICLQMSRRLHLLLLFLINYCTRQIRDQETIEFFHIIPHTIWRIHVIVYVVSYWGNDECLQLGFYNKSCQKKIHNHSRPRFCFKILIATELINIAVNDLNVKKSIGKRWVLPVTKLVLKEDQLYDLKQGLLAWKQNS